MFAWMFWDPSPAVFSWPLPFIGRPLLWYGVLFALGFLGGYYLLVYLLSHYFSQDSLLYKKKAKYLADQLLLYAIVGTVLGARFADILFYQGMSVFLTDPWAFVRIWEGGLASHGGGDGGDA